MRGSHEYIRDNYPEFQSQWLCNDNWAERWQWCQVWHIMPSISFGNFDQGTVEMFNNMGLPVACWTIDKVEDCIAACNMGAYMITTNKLVRDSLPQMPEPRLATYTRLQPVELATVDPNETINLVMGQELIINATKHGSVGIGYFLDCDTTFFNTTFYQSELPREVMPGGDRQRLRYTLRPRQTGTTVVTEIKLFRGDEERVPHTVIVK